MTRGEGRRSPDLIDARKVREDLDRAALEHDEEPAEAQPDGELVQQLAKLGGAGRKERTERVERKERTTETAVTATRDETSEYDVSRAKAAYQTSETDGDDGLTGRLEAEAAATTSARRGAVLLFELGRRYEQRDQAERALACYRSAYERYPGLAVNVRALARLLHEAGDDAACVHVLEAELNAAPSGTERAAILIQRAQLRWRRLGDLEGAKQDLQRVLDIDADEPNATHMLAELYERLGRRDEAQRLLARVARDCKDPGFRSLLLCEVARLRELGNAAPEEVVAAYRDALNADPENTHALRSLLRTARSAGDYPAVAKLCQTLASFEPGAVAASTLWESARLYAGRLRNTELAIESLQMACDRAPADLALLNDMAELYAQERRWDELAETLERARDACDDPEEAGLLGLRLARVRLERLHDGDAATLALEQAVATAPTLGPARAMLGRLYARRERWTKLCELLRGELEQSDAPERLAATHYRIGDIAEQRLGDLSTAREAYQRALESLPGYRPAVRALSRVYRRLELWQELIELYERELQQADLRDDRIVILRRIAELWERKLEEPVCALSAYERLLAIEPSHLPALRALYRIYALGSRWADLIEVLRSEADQTMDRWRRITLLTEIAAVQDHKLESRDDALASYLEVLGHAPAYQPALMAAGRILAARGDYEQLVSIHRQELANCEDPQQQSWLLLKIGRLKDDELERPEEAAEAYNEALQLDPESPAADLLLALYERRGDPLELARLRMRLPRPESPKERALVHRRIAEALLRAARPPLAIEHLQRALAAVDDDAVTDELARLYSAVGDRQSLVALYQQQVERANAAEGGRGARSPQLDSALPALHKLAVLWASAEHDLHRAVETYEAILQRLPRDRVALRQLEVLSARLEQWSALTAAIALGSEPSEDADYRSACALTIAALQEHRLGDLSQAAQAAVEVLERTPTNPEALATLERQARQTRNGERLLQVLSRQLRGSQTVAEQAALLSAMAAVHANAQEMGRAVEFYRMATEQHESFIPAPRGWLRAAREVEAIDQAALALEAEARCSVDPGWRAQCDYAASRGWRKLGRQREACAALSRVLELEPARPEALEDLTALYKQARDYQALAELYDHQIAHSDDPQRSRDLLARKADLQRRRLQDVLGARHSINHALELFPDDVQLLSTLAELCRVSSDWEALARVNIRRTQLTDDQVLLKALHFELGKLWEERLGQPRRSIAEYQRVLELDDSDLGALTRLGELLFAEREWEMAAEVTTRLAQRDEDRARVKGYHLRLAEIFADGLRDVPRAMTCCRRALAMDPGDLEATERLAELLHRQGDARGLNAHIQSCLTVHRSRLDRDPFMVGSYRALESIFARQGQRDHVHVVRSLLCAVGAATRDRFETVRAEREEAALAPRRPITEDELTRLLLHPMERGPLRALLAGAEPVLRKVHGRAERSEPKARKITARTRPELAGLLRQLARDLGCGKVEGYLVPGGVEQLRVEDSSPPALYIGEEIDELSPEELRFRIARLLAAVRLGHTLPYRLGSEGLGQDVAALLSVLCTTFAPPVDAELLDERRQRLDRAMGRRVRAKLETAALELIDRPFLPDRWLDWMHQSEARIALTLTGDVVAALEVLKREDYQLAPREDGLEGLAKSAGPQLREFLVFVVSEELLTLRERLGLALE